MQRKREIGAKINISWNDATVVEVLDSRNKISDAELYLRHQVYKYYVISLFFITEKIFFIDSETVGPFFRFTSQKKKPLKIYSRIKLKNYIILRQRK